MQNLVQTSPKLTHGWLHLMSMQKLRKFFSNKMQLNTSTNLKECTPVRKKNEKLKSYGTDDPFDAG